MIPRYSRPEMVAIWEPQSKFRIWFEIEAHAGDAMADLGSIPKENADAVWKAKAVEIGRDGKRCGAWQSILPGLFELCCKNGCWSRKKYRRGSLS